MDLGSEVELVSLYRALTGENVALVLRFRSFWRTHDAGWTQQIGDRLPHENGRIENRIMDQSGGSGLKNEPVRIFRGETASFCQFDFFGTCCGAWLVLEILTWLSGFEEAQKLLHIDLRWAGNLFLELDLALDQGLDRLEMCMRHHSIISLSLGITPSRGKLDF